MWPGPDQWMASYISRGLWGRNKRHLWTTIIKNDSHISQCSICKCILLYKCMFILKGSVCMHVFSLKATGEPVRRELLWGWTECFSVFKPPLSLFLTWSLSFLPTGTATTSFGDETTYWSCSKNRRRRRRSSRRRRCQRWLRLQPKHQPATETGCGEAVKLHKETAGKPQEVKKKHAAENFSPSCSKIKCYLLKNLWSFKNVSAEAWLLEGIVCDYRGRKLSFTTKWFIQVPLERLLSFSSQLKTKAWLVWHKIQISINAFDKSWHFFDNLDIWWHRDNRRLLLHWRGWLQCCFHINSAIKHHKGSEIMTLVSNWRQMLTIVMQDDMTWKIDTH